MLIAHLPSGYVLGVLIGKLRRIPDRIVVCAAILGAIAPDFDMLYFHLIDGRRTHHHEYFTHWPSFWLAVTVGLLGLALLTRKFPVVWGMSFGAGTALHMILDTIASPIYWLMPFSARSHELVSIPATHNNWVLSFILHWTFLLELTIWAAAIVMFMRKRHLTKTVLEKSSGM